MIRFSTRAVLILVTVLAVAVGMHTTLERRRACTERDVLGWLASRGYGYEAKLSRRRFFDLFPRVKELTIGTNDLAAAVVRRHAAIHSSSKELPVQAYGMQSPQQEVNQRILDMTPLTSLARLTEITVYCKSLDNVARLGRCRRIRGLNLMGCSVEDDDIRLFRRRMPNCQVNLTRGTR